MPISRLEHAAYDLESGVDEAAKLLEEAIEERPEIGQQIESILHQESCLQTSRMAMLILTNALCFRVPSLENQAWKMFLPLDNFAPLISG